MISIHAIFVWATAFVGAVAAPTDAPIDIVRRSTPNGQGTNDGYFYQFWTDGSAGNANYQNKAKGEYTVSWQNIGDFTAGKGWQKAEARNVTFSGIISAQGNFYLAVYTWSTQGENYILENYGSYNPCSQGKTVGTINSDGSSYQICTVDRGNNYIQNWSVRQNKQSGGIVTTANHYNAYAAHGLNHNPLGAANYQIVSTEGFESSGSADITVS